MSLKDLLIGGAFGALLALGGFGLGQRLYFQYVKKGTTEALEQLQENTKMQCEFLRQIITDSGLPNSLPATCG